MKKFLSVTLGLMVVSGLGAFFFFNTIKTSPTPQVANVSSAGTQVTEEPKLLKLKPARTAPLGYKSYRSEFYRFQFFYDTDFVLSERKEGGAATTLVFENKTENKEFQIFIVPYGEEKISQERFLKDEPSGIMASSTTTSIDGTTASNFYSKDLRLGDTYEIWFINKGFLYEVTTYAQLAPSLDQIMTSWQFL